MHWHLHPDAILMALLLLGLYALGVRAGSRSAPARRLTTAQTTLFVSGVLVLYLGAGSPIHDISERYLLSVHMVQHMLFTLVAPPLILLGTPDWMVRPLIRPRAVRAVAYAITRPFPAFLAFNLVVMFTHLPPVVDLSLRVHSFHFVVHAALTATALLMWMPVFSPLPELPRLGPFAQIVYLFVQQLLPAVIASFLAFADKVVYEFYASAPERLWGLSVTDDQQIAGIVMKLAGGTLLWGVMAVIFFRWFNHEDRTIAAAARPTLSWSEVEAELEQMGLTKR